MLNYRNQCVLKLGPLSKLYTVPGVSSCCHLSCVTSDRVWVSDHLHNLNLTNAKGDTVYSVEDFSRGSLNGGLHTLNNNCELLYIDRNHNINKLSTNMGKTTLTKASDSEWTPECLHWSQFTGDLLVGMYDEDTETGKIIRYNNIGKLIKTIKHDSKGIDILSGPYYITENSNRDIVVSDISGAVVVTDQGGKYIFKYTGHPSGSYFIPIGVCTDSLSNILVCDDVTSKIHKLDKDGRFLSYILADSKEIVEPLSLRYNANTDHLWIGTGPRNKNKIIVYKYSNKNHALVGKLSEFFNLNLQ